MKKILSVLLALTMVFAMTACGATDSYFVNPHGLHDENHFTTALDLAKITAKAYENPDFVRIVSSKTRR